MAKAKEVNTEELQRSIGDFMGFVRRAWRAVYPLGENNVWSWVIDTFIEHDQLGTSVICEKGGELFQVPMVIGENSITFADEADFVKVLRTYVPLTGDPSEGDANSAEQANDAAAGSASAAQPDLSHSELEETSIGRALALTEAHSDDPLTLDVAIIKPGWGNTRDNNYYSEGMLRECAHVFNGVKMYATDHRPDEKSVRTEVSQILECPIGFTEAGAPIARVGIFDSAFKENVLARNAHGVLTDLHCSILASGNAVDGFELDGRKGKEVIEITSAAAVDWVTKAGAGGHALGIAETSTEVDMSTEEQQKEVKEDPVEEVKIEEAAEDGQPAQEATALSVAEVEAIIATAATLPQPAIERLTEVWYADEAAVQAAVQAEVDYVKAITGTGSPPVMQQQSAEPLTEEAVTERKSAVNKKYLGKFGGN